jgi:transposase
MSQEEKPVAKRVFSPASKLAAVRRVQAGERVVTVAEALGVKRKVIYAWKDRYEQYGESGLHSRQGQRFDLVQPTSGPGSSRGELLAARRRIAELERKVGKQELELDFFAEALRRVKEAEQRSARSLLKEPRKAD